MSIDRLMQYNVETQHDIHTHMVITKWPSIAPLSQELHWFNFDIFICIKSLLKYLIIWCWLKFFFLSFSLATKKHSPMWGAFAMAMNTERVRVYIFVGFAYKEIIHAGSKHIIAVKFKFKSNQFISFIIIVSCEFCSLARKKKIK